MEEPTHAPVVSEETDKSSTTLAMESEAAIRPVSKLMRREPRRNRRVVDLGRRRGGSDSVAR
jgi:hypothetical protein